MRSWRCRALFAAAAVVVALAASARAEGSSAGDEPRGAAQALAERLARAEAAFAAEAAEVRRGVQALLVTDTDQYEHTTGHRSLLTSTVLGDAIEHVSSDGSVKLSIASDQGVTVGTTEDPELMSLTAGRVDVTGDLYVNGADVSALGGGSSSQAPVGYFARLYTSTTVSNAQHQWRTVGQMTTDTVGGWSSGHLDTNTGVFTAPVAGYYYLSGMIRLDSLSGSYARFIASINNIDSYNSGAAGHMIVGNLGSTDYHTVTVTQTIHLDAGNTIRFKTYHVNDAYYVQQVESHFSIFMVQAA